ncbi:MAG: phosphate ABC transporter ATP-binding protein PstB [Euryarchaeota archaeon]|nr:phosphate ABC transporter ATP-binding protein PstB [Euryarchaeota archaeon]
MTGGIMAEIEIKSINLNLWYGDVQALKNITIAIPEKKVTAVIGPSGCGKSTFIRCINRMNDLIKDCRVTGELLFEGRNIYDKGVDVVALRRKIGMVFQKPNPFPMSVYDNVAYGPRVHGLRGGEELDRIVEESLKSSALWGEVADILDRSALDLSGGQQQRLCIARTLAVKPKVILFDEPCSALDPISTSKIEDLINDLKDEYTIIIVTHNMQQAARVSDYTAFFLLGEVIEFGKTRQIFEMPEKKSTEDYITGRFG